MKHTKKQTKKINNDNFRKGITTIILLFFVMVILFQKNTQPTELQFVWNTDTTTVHNAAQQRDYLFEDESGQEVYQGTIGTGNTTWTTTGKIGTTIDNSITPNDVIQKAETWKIFTWQIFTWTIHTGSNTTWTIRTWSLITGSNTTWVISTWVVIKEQQTTSATNTWNIHCVTPWGEIVKDKDFVLAYQQRKDVNTICNIEKRACNNGFLWWSFIQSSCKEDVVYVYKKAEVISYNQQVINTYIQPTTAKNVWAEFTTQGKINETTKPIDTRGTSNNPVRTQSGIAQTTLPTKIGCISPRWQKIEHGQFVKAYKAPRWFIDLACDVEIRACVNGSLKGAYIYNKCTFNNTTYSEYLKAGSPKSNTGFLFFQRIKAAFRRQ